MEFALAALALVILSGGRRRNGSDTSAGADTSGDDTTGGDKQPPSSTGVPPDDAQGWGPIASLGVLGGKALVGAIGGKAATGTAATGTATTGTAATAVSGKGAAGFKTAATAAVATIGGVSVGFVAVASLWALALVTAIVVSNLMAPEMTRRRTLNRLYSTEEGSFVWTSARLWFARLVSERIPGSTVTSITFPSLSTAWGELQTIGSLAVVTGGGLTSPPPGSTDAYPDDQYAVYAWPASRPAPDPATGAMVAQAHLLARLWAGGLSAAAVSVGAAGGDELALAALNSTVTGSCALLVPSTDGGPSVLSSFAREMAAANSSGLPVYPSDADQRAAWLEGCRTGLEIARRFAFGFGGRPLIEGVESDVASNLAAITTRAGIRGIVAAGRHLDYQGTLVLEVRA